MTLPPREVTLTLEPKAGDPGGEFLAGSPGGLYGIISANRSSLVELRFNIQSDIHMVSLYGYITKVESPAWSKKLEIKLTIRC